MNIDRIKIAVKLEDVQELKYKALYKIWNSRKYPTDKPVFSLRKMWGVLLIDMSVPRSLFNNTLEEVAAEDMNQIVANIQVYAREIGLHIPTMAILNADVWYLEIGKNIILPNRYSIYNILLKLGKCLAKRKNWVGKVKYYSNVGNTGLKVCLRNEGREVCFYDKTTKEISSGGAYNKNNQMVFKKLLEDGWQVLRYEVKFFNSSSVKRELKKYGGKAKFKDLWNAEIVHKLLLHYWKDIEQTMPSVRLRKAGLVKSIQTAVRNGVNNSDILSKVGFDYLEQQLGATTLKQLLVPIENKIEGKAKEQSYGQIRKKCNRLNGQFKVKKEYVAQKINQYLQEMKPIRINKETGDIEGVL